MSTREEELTAIKQAMNEALKHHIGDTPACEQVAAAIRLFADVVAKGFYPNFKLSWDGSHELLIETTIIPPIESIRIIPTL